MGQLKEQTERKLTLIFWRCIQEKSLRDHDDQIELDQLALALKQ